ncbi:MAG: hypothetical protein HKN04_00320 [Rhodothermaceae bacterium]|nr:hypothetical protein [Rhodothermaceae bacterium]
MSSVEERIAALVAVALAWREPDHPARAEAVARTLEADNRYTEEMLAFALNQAMHQVTEQALMLWLDGRSASSAQRVSVWTGDPEPLAGWRDLLAVMLVGHRGLVRLPDSSPHLLPAFVEELETLLANVQVTVVGAQSLDRLPDGVEAVLGSGDDSTMDALGAACEDAGLDASRCLLRGEQVAVGVLGGGESAGERIGLAEDVLLYGGVGRHTVKLIWAPAEQSPDPLLDAFAGFRELMPAHPSMNGTLQMPRAFLAAADTPHAWGEGFLVSWGEPSVQQPGHLRWAPYEDLREVATWLVAHADTFSIVVASPRVGERLAWPGPVVEPGDAHRPPLVGAPGLDDPIALLARL